MRTMRQETVPKPLPPTPEIEVPEKRSYRLKNRLLGPPLATERLEHERLGKPTALAVFSLVVPITVAMLIVLAFLILSYRETIKAYPTAGGAYMVTRDNFGLLPAQIAGVALLTDYVLTVSVSVAAGTAALSSAFDVLAPYAVPISVAFIFLIAFGNLKGVRESGKIFAVPTYFFIVIMGLLLGWGFLQYMMGNLPTASVHQHGLLNFGSGSNAFFMG